MSLRAKSILPLLLLALTAALALTREQGSAAPLPGIGSVAAGGGHTCALSDAGHVKCWGSAIRTDGEFPIGSVTPVDVPGLEAGVRAIAAGTSDVCAVTAAAVVQCADFGSSSTTVPGLNDAATVATETSELTRHACVVTSTGGAKCFGSNRSGELGDDMACGQTCATPVDVVSLPSGVRTVTVGAGNSCALTAGGAVKCWGLNDIGQVGDGTNTDRHIPVPVAALTDSIIGVAAGSAHVCVVTSAGAVKCWGRNNAGQLGSGTTINSNIPVEVCATGATPPCNQSMHNALTGIAAVAAGGDNTCVVTTAGGVKCWGANNVGQLGNGSESGPQQCPSPFGPFSCSKVPVDVSGLASGITNVFTGRTHSCAVRIAHTIVCWGGNFWGELGDGTTTNRTTPVEVVDAPRFPPGDVNCRGNTDSIDAAVLLQHDARLLPLLACRQNADLNHDRRADSLDALIVLQYSAGLIHTLPVR